MYAPAIIGALGLEAIQNTLPETNIAPENGWLEDGFPFGMAQSQGLCYF